MGRPQKADGLVKATNKQLTEAKTQHNLNQIIIANIKMTEFQFNILSVGGR